MSRRGLSAAIGGVVACVLSALAATQPAGSVPVILLSIDGLKPD